MSKGQSHQKEAKAPRWKAKVKMFKEVIRWTSTGPVGGLAGKWFQQEREAFHKWLNELPSSVQGVFFIRNGRVWGVIGPDMNSPEAVKASTPPPSQVHPPSSRVLYVILNGAVNEPNAGKCTHQPLWLNKASQAISQWEKKASWVPEIGHIKEMNAWGVIPPKDGRPKNWMKQAKALFEEHQREKRLESKKLEAAPAPQPNEKEEEEGWLSSKWDHIFEEIGASPNARIAYDFMDRCFGNPGLDTHLNGIGELLCNPKSLRCGYNRTMYFKFITDLFSKSLFWLEMLYRNPETGNPDLDKTIAEWAGDFLATHCGGIVRGWKQYEEGKKTRAQGLAAHKGTEFLAQALRGHLENEFGKKTDYSVAGPHVFRDRFEIRSSLKRRIPMREFAERCLSRSGYLKEKESSRKSKQLMEKYHARLAKAKEQGVPWEPIVDQEASILMSTNNVLEKETFPRMSETQFRYAWNRGGKKPAQLKLMVDEHEKRCEWGSIEHYQSAVLTPLPIKGVVARELPWLHQQYEKAGRKKTVNGKRRNGSQYQSDIEAQLRSLIRELVGLPKVEHS